MSAHRALPGHLFSLAPHRQQRERQEAFGGWLGAEAGLEGCPSYIVEEGGGGKSFKRFQQKELGPGVRIWNFCQYPTPFLKRTRNSLALSLTSCWKRTPQLVRLPGGGQPWAEPTPNSKVLQAQWMGHCLSPRSAVAQVISAPWPQNRKLFCLPFSPPLSGPEQQGNMHMLPPSSVAAGLRGWGKPTPTKCPRGQSPGYRQRAQGQSWAFHFSAVMLRLLTGTLSPHFMGEPCPCSATVSDPCSGGSVKRNGRLPPQCLPWLPVCHRTCRVQGYTLRGAFWNLCCFVFFFPLVCFDWGNEGVSHAWGVRI